MCRRRQTTVMKKIALYLLIFFPYLLSAQSETTQEFHQQHEDAFVLFFYNNTLKMLNMEENMEFEALIKDIDKMKFVRVHKQEENLTKNDIENLIVQYHEEEFEDLMTLRQENTNINVYIRENGGVTKGLLFLMEDEKYLSILDIKGKVPLNKLANLLSAMRSEFKRN